MRITASSMLSKDDVDQMVNDAQEHAEEDRQRREEVETRNQADALAFQAERTLRDLGDKVGPADRAEVERGIEAVREALKGSDVEAVKSGRRRARRAAPEGGHRGLRADRTDRLRHPRGWRRRRCEWRGWLGRGWGRPGQRRREWRRVS